MAEQRLDSISAQMSNTEADFHSLREQMNSVEERVDSFPAALREARRSEREVLSNFERRLSEITNGARDQELD